MYSMIRTLLLTVFCVFGLQAVSQEVQISSQNESTSLIEKAVQNAAIEEGLIVPVQHSHWVFLGCVHTEHECDDTAHSYGYHQHTASHDHHTCSNHQPYACYGQH